MNPRKTRVLALSAAAIAAAVLVPASAQGDDRAAVQCGGQPATIVGTPGNDRIRGTSGSDVITARGGNDVVQGLGGDDRICPGPGRDALTGGAGDDEFVSEATADGSDVFVGDSGRDRVSYLFRDTAVEVTLDGQPDDGAANERDNVRLSVEDVSGGSADDVLRGSDVANVLDGQSGDDTLNGAEGDDTLRGGNNSDALIGRAGDDDAIGGSGDDAWLADSEQDGADLFEGGTGIDEASYAARRVNVTLVLNDIADDGELREGDDIRLDVENIVGGDGDDLIVAARFQENPNTLVGGPGEDFIGSEDPLNADGDVVDGGPQSDFCATDANDTRIGCERS